MSPMSDLISRQEVIDMLKDLYHAAAIRRERASDYVIKAKAESGMANVATMIVGIKKLPSAQQWIPVSERLPEEDGRYLTTNGQGWYEVASYAHRYSDIDAMYDLPQDGSGWYIYDSEWGYCVYSSVVAWMPLPDPWKGERE